MTRQMESTELDAIVQLLADHGFDGMAQAIEIVLNEAMKLQRSEALGALPYQRTDEPRGHANGFKPKRVASRLGKLELQVPQTRGVEFYPRRPGTRRAERTNAQARRGRDVRPRGLDPQGHWREFLASLQERGLHGVRHIVSDDHAGLKQAREARFAGVPWQRRQFHLAQNALQYWPAIDFLIHAL